MNIRGLQKTSLVDCAGRLCTVLFTGGCNFNCRFCHNPELAVNDRKLSVYSDEEVFELLISRKKLIDSVVISGGEPCLNRDLYEFIERLKKNTFFVKLDTNGYYPDILERLLAGNLLDYVAMDIKTSPAKYDSLTCTTVDFSRIKRSFNALMSSGIDYELRTTCVPVFIALDDFAKIKEELGHVKKYYLQQFVNKVTLDSTLKNCQPYPESELLRFKEFVRTFADICEIRGI